MNLFFFFGYVNFMLIRLPAVFAHTGGEAKIHKNFILLERSRNMAGIFREHPACYNESAGRGKRPEKYRRNYIMYFDSIAKIVAERTGCDVSTVKPESKFAELGIDSLDTVELLMSLEDEIGIEIELDQKVETVGDLDKFIQSKQG